MNLTLRRCWESALRAWQDAQVELNVPCLAISLLLEAIPLRAPSDGVDKSFLFWVRAYGIAYVVVFSMLQECCYLVPRIPFSNVSILVAAAICALGTVSSSYGMALTIGFPVPFMMITGSPALMILQSAAMVIMWGRYLARNQDARQAFTNYFNLTGMQIATIWVYPAYAFVFNRLSAGRQVAAMAMLPVIKLTIKNIFARLVGDKNDLRPCVVVLNADLFHTLFLSWCMNSATSKVAVVSMVLVDVVESMLALHDMKSMLAHIKGAKEHDSTPLVLLDAAVALATTAQVQVGPHQAKPLIGGPTVQVGQILRLHGRSWRRVHPVPGHSIQPRPYAFGCSNLLKKKPSVVTIASTDAEPQSITAAKTAQQASRLSDVSADNPQVRQFLRLSLQLLFFTEVVLLMEFVEIMIPLVYSIFLMAVYHLPNRAFLSNLRDLSLDDLTHNVMALLCYSLLELASILVFGLVLWQQTRISALRQLAFVLETHLQLVQVTLLLRVVYMMQTPLVHFGTDFTFRFEWLDH